MEKRAWWLEDMQMMETPTWSKDESVSLRKWHFAEQDFTGHGGRGGVSGDERGASWRWQNAMVGGSAAHIRGCQEPSISGALICAEFSALVFGSSLRVIMCSAPPWRRCFKASSKAAPCPGVEEGILRATTRCIHIRRCLRDTFTLTNHMWRRSPISPR